MILGTESCGSDLGEPGFVESLVGSRIWPANVDRIEGTRSRVARIRSSVPAAAATLQLRSLAEARAKHLVEILRRSNPLFILGRFADCAEFTDGASRDWYDIHGVHAMVQYAVGVAFATSPPIDPLPPPSDEDTQEAFDLVAEIFLIEWDLIACRSAANLPEHVAKVQGAFRVEALTDRWQGYDVHLKAMLAEALGPVRDETTRELGWDPTIIPELGVGLARLFQRRMDEFQPRFRAELVRAKAAGSAVYDNTIRRLLARHKNFVADLFVVDAISLSAELGLDIETLEKALQDLSWSPGQQPNFLLPTQDNLARTYGGVSLGDGSYFLWMPSALIQEAHIWFYDLLQQRSLESIKKRYLAARDSATEQITSSTLQLLFGKQNVIKGAQYDAPGRPDVDCIVIVPGDVMLVECKAHLMTAAGRRGAPGRLATKFDELVVKPSFQAARAAHHIASGNPISAKGRRLAPLEISEVSLLPRIVITHERVDPFGTYRSEQPSSGQPSPSWIVPLADLMAVADLIRSPSAFWHYATQRYRQSQDPRLVAFNEMDLLGLFLSDLPRFESLTNLTLAADQRVSIGPCGHSINNHYTSMRANAASVRPGVPLPMEVLSALDQILNSGDPTWSSLVELVMAEPLQTWTKFKNLKAKMLKREADRSIRLMTVQNSLEITMTKTAELLVVDVRLN